MLLWLLHHMMLFWQMKSKIYKLRCAYTTYARPSILMKGVVLLNYVLFLSVALQ